MRAPMMSGHCRWPGTDDPQASHDLCHRNGGGNTAVPTKEFAPCPCSCHYPGDRYECECGGELAEAPLWPDEDGTGDERYTHVDPETGVSLGPWC